MGAPQSTVKKARRANPQNSFLIEPTEYSAKRLERNQDLRTLSGILEQ
jgi:hypothetical protein